MIIARAIKPARPLQSSIFRDEMNRAAKNIAKETEDAFKRTVANWKHKVKFTTKILSTGTQSISVIVTTDDEIYFYIDKGTKVRYATMSKDWQSKTEPNVVGTFPGRGRRLFVNKKRPRPGIKQRNFSKHIAKTMKPELDREVKNALARFARRSGHSIKK